MSKEINQGKYFNYLISFNKEILKSDHSYCHKYGSILIKDKVFLIYYTFKSKQIMQKI